MVKKGKEIDLAILTVVQNLADGGPPRPIRAHPRLLVLAIIGPIVIMNGQLSAAAGQGRRLASGCAGRTERTATGTLKEQCCEHRTHLD
jgi:hypothetical protein